MFRRTIAGILLMVVFPACQSITFLTTDDYLGLDSSRYVLVKKDANQLEGPYTVVETESPARLITERAGETCIIRLRGVKGLGGRYDDLVKASYREDRDLYLFRECSMNLAPNEVSGVVYLPANRVYIGKPDGFDNLTYTMPQLLHVAYGHLLVDHSDTNHPMYRSFCKAEYLAKKFRHGYWGTAEGKQRRER